MHVLPWPVAFESVIIYIKMVEASPTMYTLGDVVHKAGGLDSIRAQALVLAKTHYPSFFRTPGVFVTRVQAINQFMKKPNGILCRGGTNLNSLHDLFVSRGSGVGESLTLIPQSNDQR